MLCIHIDSDGSRKMRKPNEDRLYWKSQLFKKGAMQTNILVVFISELITIECYCRSVWS